MCENVRKEIMVINMMKLGISGQALGDVLPFGEIVKKGKKCGVYDYEIWPCNAGVENDYAKADLSRIKDVMQREQIRICCVTLGAGFSKAAASDPELYSRLLINAVDAARELGAAAVNHYCGFICPSAEPDFEILEKFWRKPLEYAENQGITLVLENEAHDCTSTPEKMFKILEHFSHKNFKTNFDAVNYFHASCEGFPWAYNVLKPYIGYVHIKNACLYNPEANQPGYNRGAPMGGCHAPSPIQYAPIPHGAVNIPALLSALEEGYEGVCTLEPHTDPEHVEEFYTEESLWLYKLGFFK